MKKVVLSFLKRVKNNDVSGMAAQLAYFFLLSLFPLLLILVTLLPYLPITQEDMLNIIRTYAPADSMKLIEENLQEVMKGNTRLLSLGIIATIWSASNGMNAIIRSFNKSYNVDETRHYIVARLMSIVMTFAMVFVFILALLLPVFGKQIGMVLFSSFGFSEAFIKVWSALRWVISSNVLLFVFIMLYWLAPNKRMRCLSVLPGAIFTVLGWSIVSFAFGFYVEHFGNFSTTYGSLGAIIILMIWFYLSGIMIILGSEINAIASERKKPKCE